MNSIKHKGLLLAVIGLGLGMAIISTEVLAHGGHGHGGGHRGGHGHAGHRGGGHHGAWNHGGWHRGGWYRGGFYRGAWVAPPVVLGAPGYYGPVNSNDCHFERRCQRNGHCYRVRICQSF